jgi:hypothetical protein
MRRAKPAVRERNAFMKGENEIDSWLKVIKPALERGF